MARPARAATERMVLAERILKIEGVRRLLERM